MSKRGSSPRSCPGGRPAAVPSLGALPAASQSNHAAATPHPIAIVSTTSVNNSPTASSPAAAVRDPYPLIYRRIWRHRATPPTAASLDAAEPSETPTAWRMGVELRVARLPEGPVGNTTRVGYLARWREVGLLGPSGDLRLGSFLDVRRTIYRISGKVATNPGASVQGEEGRLRPSVLRVLPRGTGSSKPQRCWVLLDNGDCTSVAMELSNDSQDANPLVVGFDLTGFRDPQSVVLIEFEGVLLLHDTSAAAVCPTVSGARSVWLVPPPTAAVTAVTSPATTSTLREPSLLVSSPHTREPRVATYDPATGDLMERTVRLSIDESDDPFASSAALLTDDPSMTLPRASATGRPLPEATTGSPTDEPAAMSATLPVRPMADSGDDSDEAPPLQVDHTASPMHELWLTDQGLPAASIPPHAVVHFGSSFLIGFSLDHTLFVIRREDRPLSRDAPVVRHFTCAPLGPPWATVGFYPDDASASVGATLRIVCVFGVLSAGGGSGSAMLPPPLATADPTDSHNMLNVGGGVGDTSSSPPLTVVAELPGDHCGCVWRRLSWSELSSSKFAFGRTIACFGTGHDRQLTAAIAPIHVAAPRGYVVIDVFGSGAVMGEGAAHGGTGDGHGSSSGNGFLKRVWGALTSRVSTTAPSSTSVAMDESMTARGPNALDTSVGLLGEGATISKLSKRIHSGAQLAVAPLTHVALVPRASLRAHEACVVVAAYGREVYLLTVPRSLRPPTP